MFDDQGDLSDFGGKKVVHAETKSRSFEIVGVGSGAYDLHTRDGLELIRRCWVVRELELVAWRGLSHRKIVSRFLGKNSKLKNNQEKDKNCILQLDISLHTLTV
jgi:hypothetical protein